MRYLFFCSVFMTIDLAFQSPAMGEEAKKQQVISIWEDTADVDASAPLSYAKKDAPKGGTLRLTAFGSYDNLNPFSPRGIAAAYLQMTYETLGVAMEGDDFVTRGLLAESFVVAPDYAWIDIYLRPEARFSDGKPVTAEDVVFSFNELINKGSPMYKNYYANIKEAKVMGDHVVRFIFTETNNKELPIIVTQLPVLPKHWWQGRDLGAPSLEAMPGSGPYQVADVNVGSAIVLRRNPNWWGKDLAMNQGRYNFDEIKIDYYRSQSVAREAFLAGEADLYRESTIKDWFSAYNSPDVKEGRVIKSELPSSGAKGMTGFFFNTRSPQFKDMRVRKAIALLFDFEWTNKRLFHDSYARHNSFFTGSRLAAPDVPSEQEKVFLASLGQEIPADFFEPIERQLVSDGSGSIRDRYKHVLSLLKEAGWELRDGVMVNKQGQPLQFKLTLISPNMERVVLPFQRNLQRLGIKMDVDLADQSRYVNQLRHFKYDMILGVARQSESPGNEQRNLWTSAAAKMPMARNYAGVSDPLVDAIVERLITSANKEQLTTATHALDRALLKGWYVIPGWYSPNIFVAWRPERIVSPEKYPASGFDITTWYRGKNNPNVRENTPE